MTRSRPPQMAFSSGEIQPLLYARSDYQRFQTGLRTCLGYLPLRQGGVTRAPGTIYRGNTRNNAEARLISFEFAENDALTLEFTDGFMRVWRYGALVESGGIPYEIATPYDAAAIKRLDWVQSADVIYLVDGILPMQKLSRFALDNWTIADVELNAGPFKVQNLDEALTIQCSAATGSISLTGVGGFFDATWVGSLIHIKPTDFSSIALWTGNTVVAIGDKMRYGNNIYEVTSGTDTGVNPPIHLDGEQLLDKTTGITWRYDSDTVGIVRVTAVAGPNLATADVIRDIPDPCITDPTYRWSEGAWSARWGYPKAIEIEDQSLFAGFSLSEPRTVWVSTLGDFADFLPSGDADGSFAYAISGSASLNSGNWLRRARRGIYIGALGEVFRGFSSTAGQRIGPTTFDTSLEATDGSNSARPIAPYGYPIFITKEGSRVQEIRYSFEEDGGKPIELSLPAQHLGLGGFHEIVWQSAPQRHAWLRRGNGELAAMLYDPDEDVLGWARYPLAGGAVESLSVSTDAGTGYDTLTMVVKRVIDGATVRFIEEQAVIFGVIAGDDPIYKAVHLFASVVEVPASATDTFSVPHLIGETVYVWTDGGEYGPIVVPASGNITIAAAVSHAVIGLLDETHYAETLPITAAAKDGSSVGRQRRLHADGGVVLHKTAAGIIRGVERDFAKPDRIGAAHELVRQSVAADLVVGFSGTTRTPARTGHAAEVSYRLEPVGGAPMTVLALIPDIEEVGA